MVIVGGYSYKVLWQRARHGGEKKANKNAAGVETQS